MPKSASSIWYSLSHSQDSWVQGIKNPQKMEMVTLSTTPYYPLTKFLFPIPLTVCSIDLEVLVLEEVVTSAMKHSRHSIELKVKTSPWP